MSDFRVCSLESRSLVSDPLQLSRQTLVTRPCRNGGGHDLGNHRVEVDQETIDSPSKIIEPVLEISDEFMPFPQGQDRRRIRRHRIWP